MGSQEDLQQLPRCVSNPQSPELIAFSLTMNLKKRDS